MGDPQMGNGGRRQGVQRQDGLFPTRTGDPQGFVQIFHLPGERSHGRKRADAAQRKGTFRHYRFADGEDGPPTNFFQAFDNGADRDHIDACADHIHRIPARRRTAGPLLQSKALKKPRKRLLSTGPVQGHSIEDIGCLFGILKVDHLFPGHQAVHQLHGTASASFLRFIQLIT